VLFPNNSAPPHVSQQVIKYLNHNYSN